MNGIKESVVIEDGASMVVTRGPESENPGQTEVHTTTPEPKPFENWEVVLSNFPNDIKAKIEYSCARQKVDVKTVLTMMIVENFNTHRYAHCNYCGPEKMALRKKAYAEAHRLHKEAEKKRIENREKAKAAKKARKKNRG